MTQLALEIGTHLSPTTFTNPVAKKEKIPFISLSLAEKFQIRMSQGNNTLPSLLLFEIFFNFLGTQLFHWNVVSFCDMHIWVLWRNMIKVLISYQSVLFYSNWFWWVLFIFDFMYNPYFKIEYLSVLHDISCLFPLLVFEVLRKHLGKENWL